MRAMIFSLVMLYLPTALGATTAHSRDEVAEHFRQQGFSGVAAVSSADSHYQIAFGSEGARPIVAGDRFLIGSVTKQFTAAAILKLVDKGRVAITDSVARHLPTFRYTDVTVHDLLAQVSGVSEVTTTQEFASLIRKPFTGLQPLIDVIVGLPIEFPRGSRWGYSNSNYMLLARIVEVASGESWWSFVKRELIDPAGMTSTDFVYNRGEKIVTGHQLDRACRMNAIAARAYLERGWAHGAGGLESTLADLERWNAALYGGHLLSESSLRLMTTAHAKADDGSSYGYGVFVSKDPSSGEIVYYHSGAIPGFSSQNIFFPKRGLSIVALGNYMAKGPIEFARALSRIEITGQAALEAKSCR